MDTTGAKIDSPGSPLAPGIPGSPLFPFYPLGPYCPRKSGGLIMPCFPLFPGGSKIPSSPLFPVLSICPLRPRVPFGPIAPEGPGGPGGPCEHRSSFDRQSLPSDISLLMFSITSFKTLSAFVLLFDESELHLFLWASGDCSPNDGVKRV